ncbi:MAG TPA: flagellar basal-body MS-ring/collar protein FliF [Phycisphaerae bacterium]|nr:flagellar basal-body MS-ring/collar protein FliF [Phycisphaerae bacterium]
MASNIGEIWRRTSLIQRVLLVGIGLAFAGAATLLVGWARRPNLTLLYSRLDPAEAAKIVEKLRDSDTPYELKDGGTTVYVPEEKVYSLRLSLVQQGLPASDQVGYRILDEEKFGASPFAQHVNFTRALEGELAKTIRLIDGVAHVRVHVVRPEKSVLARQRNGASATVALQLKPGWRFGGSSAAAIVHLVAGAVEGLKPERVVVVDSKGNVLSGDSDDPLAKGAGTFLDYRTRLEQALARKAEDMLTAVLGPNRASVRVSATLERDGGTETKETIDPASKVILKEKIVSSSTTGAGTSGGAAGAGSKEETTDSTYLVGKTIAQKTTVPGAIKSLAVAAFVDLSGGGADANQAGPAVALKDVEEVIRTACGLGAADNLKVVDVRFHKSPESEQTAAASGGLFNKDFILEIAKRASLGILVIGALLALKILGGKKKRSESASPQALPGQAAASERLLPAAGEVDPAMVRARISRALAENPEEVKRLFLTWVEGEKGEM